MPYRINCSGYAHVHMHTVIYAASAAIVDAYKKNKSPKGATLYTNLYPGGREGAFIYHTEVKEVVYLEHKKDWRKRYHTGATKRVFDGEVVCR